MDNMEIKKANRKALPKYVLFIVIAMAIGGVIGFLAAFFEIDSLAEHLKNAGRFFSLYIAPWLMLALAVLLPLIATVLYSQAKKLLPGWDGMDETVSDAVDEKLSILIWISSAASILSFFLLTAAYSGGFSTFENVYLFLLTILAFFAVLIENILIGQKCVDATKVIYPEKTASVYDMKFQKKWLDSCDEAEKILIGKCAFRAYMVTNTFCGVLAGILAVSALFLDIGFLPSLVVCLIWGVNLSVYCKESMKYNKAGNKIS